MQEFSIDMLFSLYKYEYESVNAKLEYKLERKITLNDWKKNVFKYYVGGSSFHSIVVEYISMALEARKLQKNDVEEWRETEGERETK